MYLKAELPDGYFRLFDDISNLVIPKERIMVSFPPPPKDVVEDSETCHGISVWDAIDCMSKEAQHQISHLIGYVGQEKHCRPEILFSANSRVLDKSETRPHHQVFPYYQMIIFSDKHGVTNVFCTQYPVYVCNDEGKTMEKVK